MPAMSFSRYTVTLNRPPLVTIICTEITKPAEGLIKNYTTRFDAIDAIDSLGG